MILLCCPLCLFDKPEEFWVKESGLVFYRCPRCELVFKDPAERLTPEEELKCYDLHENFPEDIGYQKHLNVLCEALSAQLVAGQSGIDYGCGPTPLMAELFNQKGFPCVSYDPYYFTDKKVLDRGYDFVSCCEVAEHFYYPSKEFFLLFGLLKPGALLGVRTRIVPEDFARWWYHKDPTHVVFYSRRTFEWIAEKFLAQLQFLPQDVVILRKR